MRAAQLREVTRQVSRLVLVGTLALGAAMRSASPAPAWAEEGDSPHASVPTTAQEWLVNQHRVFRRYLAVVRQAVHDYRYGYQTPALLMPVAMDLFTGYVAHIHTMEEQALYPVIRPHLTAPQQHVLWLIEDEQHSERETVKQWQRQLLALEPGKDLAQVTETIDYLGQLVNRHLVLQEEHLLPLLETLTSEEHAAVLEGVAGYERETFGPLGRERYEELLAWIEEQIKALSGRVW